MLRPAVFFDRDNTLIVNNGYLGNPDNVVLISQSADVVARARYLGFLVVTISNQSGVARGLFDEKAVRAVDQRMDDLLLQANPAAVIDLHLYCPYHPDATVPAYRQKSDLRKPAPGMILLAAKKLELDLPRSWVIGDGHRDVEAGKRAGCRTILFIPPGVIPSPAATEQPAADADYVVTSLQAAIDQIARSASQIESKLT